MAPIANKLNNGLAEALNSKRVTHEYKTKYQKFQQKKKN